MTATIVGCGKDGSATVRVHVQPRSARSRLCGIHDGRLKLAVNAPPVDGKANRAVAEFLAHVLGVKSSSVTLLSGLQSRKKLFGVASLSEAEVRQRLAGLLMMPAEPEDQL
ncbi:DUF167 domain-containing protein [Desulfofustis limnaeus]|uniref:UPF0235 protein DPPLL_00990 n=1 Tax=Desulfofustis limnaeus TaxID=2740163 RepID=A0ABM7W491_9BACT|nr:DUF167 domain-containing protein [Desulfofustis limnaeus]MDX9896455.1 DUF167 domain-containing protein [Desulfofustis sp.]BDD85734.1 hypothetical protein DPPLL_00990 [Desulfofustis limnaeus]